jgi:hypothetical protein
LKALSTIDRMKRSHEKATAQQQIHTIQIKVMEITQRIQPVQDKACLLFTKVESQGVELEQVVITVEQCLEEPLNDAVIQEFTKQEAIAKKQVKAFEAELGRPQ